MPFISKRQKFIFASLLLSVCLLGIQWVQLDYRYVAVFGFFLITYLVSAWALFDDLKGVEWITILSLPSAYAVGVSLFYFLLPENFLSRIVILSLFGLGLYALYLTENIYSVAAVRTIQLLRAAHAVGFLISLLTLALLYNTVFSLKWMWWLNGLLVLAVSFPIILQALWSVELSNRIEKHVWIMALGLTLLLVELTVILSFLPVTVWIAALCLATLAYVGVGLFQHQLENRLFSRTVYEYVAVGLFVLVAALIVTPWR